MTGNTQINVCVCVRVYGNMNIFFHLFSPESDAEVKKKVKLQNN